MGDDAREVVVVSDTSVLIDLERGTLLEAAFRLPFAFAVPDLLYEQELKANNGLGLLELGLQINELDSECVAAALSCRSRAPVLSLPDCFALALAMRSEWTLLTGDAALRKLAEKFRVDCRGLLWLLDLMLSEQAATHRELHSGLLAISRHPRCRLPKAEVRERLNYLEDDTTGLIAATTVEAVNTLSSHRAAAPLPDRDGGLARPVAKARSLP